MQSMFLPQLRLYQPVIHSPLPTVQGYEIFPGKLWSSHNRDGEYGVTFFTAGYRCCETNKSRGGKHIADFIDLWHQSFTPHTYITRASAATDPQSGHTQSQS